MDFWSLAYEQHWIGETDEEQNVTLRQVVKTKDNPFGEISPEEYKIITGIDFIVEEKIKPKKTTTKKDTKKDETVTEEKKEEVKPVIEDNKTK